MLRDFYWPISAPGYLFNRFLIVCSILFLLVGKALSLLSPFFLGKTVTYLTKADRYNTILYLSLFSVCAVFATIFDELRNLCYRYVQSVSITNLSTRIYAHLHSLNYQWFANNKGGEIIRAMSRGLESTRELTHFGVILLIPTLLESLGVCILFFTYFNNPYLSLSLIVGMFLYFLTTVLITRYRMKIRQNLAKVDNEVHAISSEGITNFETVKYYTNEEYEIRKYTVAVKEYERCNWKIFNSLSTINIVQDIVKQGTIFMSLGLGAYHVYYHKAEIGTMMSIQAYIFMLFKPLSILGTIYSTIIKSLVGIQDAADLLNTKPTIVDKEGALELDLSDASDCVGPLIELKDVSFSYSDTGCIMANLTLKNISFSLNYGSTVAIVGATGGGKTTIGRLICRLYDPSVGTITINGIPITDLTQKSIRKYIGVVAQDTMLFHDTIRENVRYAKLDATEDEIYDALKKARLYDRVIELPEKLDTVIGERGIKLSGGEKQRLSIARCFLKDPPIIILDEATSALDSKTETQIQETISSLTTKKTTMVIAHRLSTIVAANLILVLDKGEIVEQGTHSDLLSRGGAYTSLWNAQLKIRAEVLEDE